MLPERSRPVCFSFQLCAQNWGGLTSAAFASRRDTFQAALTNAMASYLTIKPERVQFLVNITQSPRPNDPRSYVQLLVQYPGSNGGAYPTNYYIDMVR